MDWNHYRFRSVWDLPAEPADVFAALERAEDYPLWWSQVREATPLDERRGTARFRSLLPYDLFVTATALRRDTEAGVLEIALSGDLEGWVRWTVRAHAGGTRALYEQGVEVCKPLLRRFALVGRPVFLVNHALMMRGGRHGLVAHLRRC
ncbi:SRPBCC family protein [Streptomyces sp. NPDC001939]|uniref:SRPBCC family protein n=1 Tax=Streptomyces TaxID=1883 RepID=UPI001D0A4CB0|nr:MULTISPECIES: SRPBCC family protein [Streptomyces]MCX5080483.1 polyketide cyclase [Streptomyces sp. NBC_00401]UDL98722.1 polyketide cyclase [Streptomyces longhuiensis]